MSIFSSYFSFVSCIAQIAGRAREMKERKRGRSKEGDDIIISSSFSTWSLLSLSLSHTHTHTHTHSLSLSLSLSSSLRRGHQTRVNWSNCTDTIRARWSGRSRTDSPRGRKTGRRERRDFQSRRVNSSKQIAFLLLLVASSPSSRECQSDLCQRVGSHRCDQGPTEKMCPKSKAKGKMTKRKSQFSEPPSN